jgi:cell division septal protein FtsQ
MSNNKSRKYSKKKRKQNRSWLPILAVAVGVALIGMAFFSLRQNSKPKAQIEVNGSPSLKVDKDQVDLGNVKLGQTVQVSFQLTNVGDQTLRFNKQPYVEVVEGC